LKVFWKKFQISEGHRYKHTYIVAGTGAGKSELLKTFIWQHILYGKTAIIVLDPNGDFAEQVAKFKDNTIRFRKKDIIYIDPSLSTDVFPVINPVDLPNVSIETLDKVTQQLHKTMLQAFKEMDIKLTGAMDGMLYNMLHTLYRKKDSSLLDLIRFVDDSQNADLVKLGCQTDNYVIRDYFENKFMLPGASVTKQGLANRLNNFL
jgi:MinD-like ATPase involved in chromosome partitioning or flagellar assembly